MSEKPNQPPRTLRDIALATVPAAAREALLALAAEHGIARSDDPFWTIAAALANTLAAAAAAGEAATKTAAEVRKIPDAVYQGAVRAGTDLRGQVETAGQGVVEIIASRAAEIQKGLRTAVEQGIAAGAARLENAIATLDRAVVSRRDATVAEWQAAVGKGVAAASQKGIAARMARSWGVVALSLVFAAAIGATGVVGGLDLAGRIVPGWLRVYDHPGADIIVMPGTVYAAVGCPSGDTCIQVPQPPRR